MPSIAAIPPAALRALRWVLLDIDDTLTSEGRLEAGAYAALERLRGAGLEVVPITGRPAGWCDLIARLWPVSAVVGENGAFHMRYHRPTRTLERRFWQDEGPRREARRRLDALAATILAEVPGTALASDQRYRECDLAVDVAEDVAPLPPPAVERVLALFAAAGATAKLSSIHVNGWFGDWDKLAMTRRLFRDHFAADLDAVRAQALFVGDSPNDAPMFARFPLAVGVANVLPYLDRIAAPPAYVTASPGGRGFVELAEAILSVR
ncbi:MAG: HAD-IIB family hydrolase [Planctomycetes bacterium]|nr:HAD-IIB family hydrolase [Planctomycetota bacterium]